VASAEAQQSSQPSKRASKSQIEDMMPPIGPGEITVGLMGPITDGTEKNIKKYLESGGLDHVIQVDKVWDVLPKLAAVSKKAGKQIKYLILAGHGSDDPNVPGFGIGGTAFGPPLIDHVGLEWDILKARVSKDEKIKALCELQKSRDPIDRKLGSLAGTSPSEGKEYRLNEEIAEIDRVNGERFKRIVTIHDAQGIMAEDGIIVLFNCFSGLSEHLNFAMDLGVVLFGGKRGKIYIHEKAIWIGKVPDENGAWKSLVQLIGYFSEGHLKTGGKAILWANFETLQVPEGKPQLIPGILPVTVAPVYSSVREGTESSLKSDVLTMDDSSTLVYNWQGCAESNTVDCRLSL
ncbi:MAG TPA: hypothetical protein PKV86_14955, partial [Syntrophobacteraceae bacterium]|nr:hypothetical protein [Syntrophobacteraceae bacterium]